MKRVITIIVLSTFFPMQLYAVDLSGFGTERQTDYFVPRGPDRPAFEPYRDPSEVIRAEPPKAAESTNWWLWGGIGLAVVSASIFALVSGGSKNGGGGTNTTTVTGSW